MEVEIKPAREQIELGAAIEVAKTIGFYALLIGLRMMQGNQRSILENMEKTLKDFFSNCRVELPEHEAHIFREYARSTIDELFQRVNIDDQPLKSPVGSTR
jgi:hypothetical protein